MNAGAAIHEIASNVDTFHNIDFLCNKFHDDCRSHQYENFPIKNKHETCLQALFDFDSKYLIYRFASCALSFDAFECIH